MGRGRTTKGQQLLYFDFAASFEGSLNRPAPLCPQCQTWKRGERGTRGAFTCFVPVTLAGRSRRSPGSRQMVLPRSAALKSRRILCVYLARVKCRVIHPRDAEEKPLGILLSSLRITQRSQIIQNLWHEQDESSKGWDLILAMVRRFEGFERFFKFASDAKE